MCNECILESCFKMTLSFIRQNQVLVPLQFVKCPDLVRNILFVIHVFSLLFRQFSGLSLQSELSATALQRSALNIPYQIRNASGLGAQLCRPVRLSASTALPQAFGNSTTTQNTSILNRIAPLLPSMVHHPVRSLTYFGLRSGKRKTVKSVTDRFLRLHCGLWVRRKVQ
ncbi:hypothetical protein XENTR_v10000253 [Xenopus tropicalis]|nr:hypothetical protein XENTR_v10000253 [Xenopus tropicalis]